MILDYKKFDLFGIQFLQKVSLKPPFDFEFPVENRACFLYMLGEKSSTGRRLIMRSELLPGILYYSIAEIPVKKFAGRFQMSMESS